MRKSMLFIALIMVPFLSAWAQVPQGMKYQTVVRNSAGEPIADQSVSLRLTILEDGANVFQETHSMNTNDFGLVNLNIGEGTGSDDLSDVAWDAASYELQVELDPSGGSNFSLMGTSPMLSVPFALRAESANYAYMADFAANDEVDDADADPENELQSLSINGDQLSISQGNTVTLPQGESDTVEDEEKAKAWASVDIFGNSNVDFDAFNVISTSKISTGVYAVVLAPGLFSVATNPSVVVTLTNDLSAGVAIPTYGASPSQITVRTYNMSGNLADKSFNITIFGK